MACHQLFYSSLRASTELETTAEILLMQKAAFLLENGADPKYKCSIRKQLKYTGKRHRSDMNEYREATPISFADQWQSPGAQNTSIATIEFLKQKGGV